MSNSDLRVAVMVLQDKKRRELAAFWWAVMRRMCPPRETLNCVTLYLHPVNVFSHAQSILESTVRKKVRELHKCIDNETTRMVREASFTFYERVTEVVDGDGDVYSSVLTENTPSDFEYEVQISPIIKGCYTIQGRPIHNSQEWGTYVVGKLTKMTTEKLALLGFKDVDVSVHRRATSMYTFDVDFSLEVPSIEIDIE